MPSGAELWQVLMISEIVQVLYKACTACPKTFPTRNDYEQMTKYLSVMKTGKFRTYDLELRNCSCGSTLATECEKIQEIIMEKSTDNLTTDELRVRVREYAERLNNCVSCKVEFDINLKILDSLYAQLIMAIQNNS